MEPTKNPINSTGQNGQSGNTPDPIFQGMPKPGQPLTNTPRFSAHAPSALDRIMNPNLGSSASNVVPPTLTPSSNFAPTPTPAPAPSSVSPVAPKPVPPPMSSNPAPTPSPFKPYTPPTTPAPSSVVPPKPTVPPVSTSPFSSSTMTAQSTPPTSMGSMNASMPSKSSAFAPTSSSSMALAPAKVDTVVGGQGFSQVKHKNTVAIIISSVVVLLLLAGGGYYWYMTKSAPADDISQNPASGTNNTQNTNRPASAFPTGVTRPTSTTTSAVAPRPTTPTATPKPVTTKPIRVTTPFTETQRSIISSYISANINQFATPKSSRGYQVTDVTFDGPDRALVEYTDGANSYTAIVVASIDTADNVRIVNFSHLDK